MISGKRPMLVFWSALPSPCRSIAPSDIHSSGVTNNYSILHASHLPPLKQAGGSQCVCSASDLSSVVENLSFLTSIRPRIICEKPASLIFLTLHDCLR